MFLPSLKESSHQESSQVFHPRKPKKKAKRTDSGGSGGKEGRESKKRIEMPKET